MRRRGGGRGPPAAHLAADLDFVAPRAATAAEAALLEAEVILVSPPWCFRHGQAALLSLRVPCSMPVSSSVCSHTQAGPGRTSRQERAC